MANSRKSRNPKRIDEIADAFERALGEILARVRAFMPGMQAPRIGIGYSGGLDSSALLHLAAIHADRHGSAVAAFHVHHGLSPNADAWLDHCAAEARRCGLPFLARRAHVAADLGHGVEAAARIARYQALGDMCREWGATLLLTAHHQDDQAETVLLQLLRGAGLPGLSGMAALQRGHELLGPDVFLGRPLLELPRAGLEAMARELGFAHVLDESNQDLRYRRNAVRHAIAPAIEAHFPGFAARLGRSAQHAQAAQSLLQDLAEIDLANSGGDWNAPLDAAALCALSPQRADNLLRHWLQQQGVPLPSAARLAELRQQMLHAAQDAHPGIDFGTTTLRRIRGRLEMHPKSGAAPAEPILLPWSGQAEITVPAWRGSLLFEPVEQGGLPADMLMRHGLALRPRSGQERLKPVAGRPSRSLKALYQEAGIPPWRRLWSPLAYLDSELVFVAGLGMDVRHLVNGRGVALRWEAHG